jgi:hypothetical protein
MCTVTFVPKSVTDFILTSNRDEAPARNTIAPQVYSIENIDLLFPKDEVAGGTWIGLSERERMICLLNGGFTAHDRKDRYRMSRGIIVTDLLVAEDALSEIENYDFNDIEPFTIIMVNWKDQLRLHELVWDGIDSHLKEKSLAPHIWSSSLLYSEEEKHKRNQWYTQFLFENLNPSDVELLNFHKTAGDGNKHSDVIMDRGFVKTKSITQISKNKTITFRYEDLQTSKVSKLPFIIKPH